MTNNFLEPNTEDVITIQDSSFEKESFINKPFVSDGLKDNLKKADILIVPFEEKEYMGKPVFYTGFEEQYLYIKKNIPKEFSVDVAADDGSYQITLYCSDEIIIRFGTIFLGSVLLPIIVNVLSNYVSDYLKKNKKNEPPRVILKLLIKDRKGKVRNLDYNGNGRNLDKIIKAWEENDEDRKRD